MRDYGKVHSTFWTSATTADLSDQGKVLALYLMTCEHSTIAGVFRLPDGYIAEDLRWSIERVREGFAELSSKGFATRCDASKWVWIAKHLEWNPPENPNQIKAARKVAGSVPVQCTWLPAFMRAWGEYLGLELPPATQPPANPLATLPESGTVAVTGTVAVPEAGAAAGAVVAAADAPANKTKAADRGTRLPADWVLPQAWGLWTRAEFPGWSDEAIRNEGAKFKDFWIGKTGKDATKADWQATWRNWCRNAKVPAGGGRTGPLTDEGRAAHDAATDAEAKRKLFGDDGDAAAGGVVIDA